jgi:methylated-DNA-[protein]-cysteine S-methyltransferase
MELSLLAVASPVGRWGVLGDDHGVHRILMPHEMVGRRISRMAPPRVIETANELVDYFASKRRQFTPTRVTTAATAFQMDCWRALEAIPYGQVVTYADLAASIGRPRAARAVGNANHANPWPLLVPCHRVVAATGLGGYGGGIDVKEFLLTLEHNSIAAHA